VLLKGVLHGVRAVLPGMVERKRGTIVNVSSIGDRRPGPSGETYHAAKAAVRSLSESLQQGQAKNNIRVINFAPGLVKTNIHETMGISFEEYCKMLGNPDFIAPERIAEIILFCYKQLQSICIRDLVVPTRTCVIALCKRGAGPPQAPHSHSISGLSSRNAPCENRVTMHFVILTSIE
jgi:NADP-dependent 3-hydroxy acid dehydrogenase YdfG